jgi:hypothetical protein
LQASLADVGELFVSDNIAEVAVVWNDWRRGVLQAAVQERLLPAMLSELKARLTANAIETVLLQMQDRCVAGACSVHVCSGCLVLAVM